MMPWRTTPKLPSPMRSPTCSSFIAAVLGHVGISRRIPKAFTTNQADGSSETGLRRALLGTAVSPVGGPTRAEPAAMALPTSETRRAEATAGTSQASEAAVALPAVKPRRAEAAEGTSEAKAAATASPAGEPRGAEAASRSRELRAEEGGTPGIAWLTAPAVATAISGESTDENSGPPFFSITHSNRTFPNTAWKSEPKAARIQHQTEA